MKQKPDFVIFAKQRMVDIGGCIDEPLGERCETCETKNSKRIFVFGSRSIRLGGARSRQLLLFIFILLSSAGCDSATDDVPPFAEPLPASLFDHPEVLPFADLPNVSEPSTALEKATYRYYQSVERLAEYSAFTRSMYARSLDFSPSCFPGICVWNGSTEWRDADLEVWLTYYEKNEDSDTDRRWDLATESDEDSEPKERLSGSFSTISNEFEWRAITYPFGYPPQTWVSVRRTDQDDMTRYLLFVSDHNTVRLVVNSQGHGSMTRNSDPDYPYDIYWDATTGEGSIKDGNLTNNETECWGADGNDIECPTQ